MKDQNHVVLLPSSTRACTHGLESFYLVVYLDVLFHRPPKTYHYPCHAFLLTVAHASIEGLKRWGPIFLVSEEDLERIMALEM